jgi:hypothetical protein
MRRLFLTVLLAAANTPIMFAAHAQINQETVEPGSSKNVRQMLDNENGTSSSVQPLLLSEAE